MTAMTLRQRVVSRGIWGPWIVAWLGGSVLGIANGTIRELVYKDRVGDMTAHYLSTVILILLLLLYFAWLENRWPLPSAETSVGNRIRLGFDDRVVRLRLRSLCRRKVVGGPREGLRHHSGSRLDRRTCVDHRRTRGGESDPSAEGVVTTAANLTTIPAIRESLTPSRHTAATSASRTDN
jgi:hypothetical protein